MTPRRVCLIWAAFAALLAAPQASAKDTPSPPTLPQVEAAQPLASSFPSPMAGPLTRAGLALGVISLTSGALVWWSRRRRAAIGGMAARIQVLAARGLGPKHQVVLLDVAGHRILVGTAGDHITTLADLTEAPAFSAELDRALPKSSREVSGEMLDVIGRFEGLDA